MSEYDIDFFAGIDDYSDDNFWEDFADFADADIDVDLDDGDDGDDDDDLPPLDAEYPLQPPGNSLDDQNREIHSISSIHQRTDMTNGRIFSPPFQQYNNLFDNPFSDSDSDPFRPLSSNSNHRPVIDLTSDSPPLGMAPKRKLSGAAAIAVARKKQRLSSSATDSRSASRQSTATPGAAKIETVDLTDVDQYELLDVKKRREKREKEALEAQRAKEEAEKPQTLADFECVICLENPSDLVVTHCGHLFCSECLHNALESGPGGSRCPSCRSKIITRNMLHGKESKQSYYPLEIRLKISTKSGKRRAR